LVGDQDGFGTGNPALALAEKNGRREVEKSRRRPLKNEKVRPAQADLKFAGGIEVCVTRGTLPAKVGLRVLIFPGSNRSDTAA